MASKLAPRRSAAKSSDCRIRNQKSRNRNQNNPVLLKLREILKAEINGEKAAYQLSEILNRSYSSCQKMLNGVLPINGATFNALLRWQHGDKILAATMGDDPAYWPHWYAKERADLDVIAIGKELAERKARFDAVLNRTFGQ